MVMTSESNLLLRKWSFQISSVVVVAKQSSLSLRLHRMLSGFTHYQAEVAHVIPSPIDLELILESFSHDVYTKVYELTVPCLAVRPSDPPASSPSTARRHFPPFSSAPPQNQFAASGKRPPSLRAEMVSTFSGAEDRSRVE